MPQQPIILFDGVCNLCNAGVNFVIKRDKKSCFKFAPLQSEGAKKILAENCFTDVGVDSFILILDKKVYTQSTAALKVCVNLPIGYKLLYAFIIVPKFIRDAVYNWVAKNRYRWFGQKDICMIPTENIKARFLN